ncbi:MAG: hypothetical protein N3D84_03030 [Candidatus Woesearchaeota archaeon]|nr:hypothetical protein [Candidatus Woesearchaeota archaeon]
MSDPRVAKYLGKSHLELLYEFFLVEKLEKVGDKSKRIARYLRKSNMKEEEKKELERIYISMRDAYNNVMKAYYKNDIKTAFDIEISNKEKIKAMNDFIKERQNAYTHMVIEQMKSMSTSIKNIGRCVIGMEKNRA